MTLHDVGRALRERWVAVVASVLVALLAGVALFLVRPPSYTATLTVYAATRATDPASTTPEAAYQGSLLAKERIPSYVQLVTSPQVISQVIARARLQSDVDDLTGRVTATNTADSVLLDVAVTAPTATEAVATANAFGDVLPTAVAQIEQSGLPGAPPAVSVRAIGPVPVPLRPSSPGLSLTLIVALLAGVIVGLAVALVRDALDRSMRTTDDLEEALAGAGLAGPAPPVLAALPVTGSRGSAAAGSRDAEAYRQLRTALHAGRHAAPGVLAVTSPGAGEGRTTVTCSLAAAAAAAGLAVVVVDADLRRPRVANVLDIAPGTGLTDVLAGRVNVEAAIRATRAGYDALLSGSLPSNPSELLAGGGLAELFATLHMRYDLVLVDTPPTLPVTDAAVVAEATGGVVVLARTRRTRPADLSRALHTFEAADATVVGAVLVGAAHGPALVADPGDRSAIVPKAVRAAIATEGPRSVAASRSVPEPRALEPRAPEPRAAESRAPESRAPEPRTTRTRSENGRPPEVRPTPAPRSSRHGLPADATATVASPVARPRVPPVGTGRAGEDAPTLTAGTAHGGPRPASPRSDGSALSFAGVIGSGRERNGHGPNGSAQNGSSQNGSAQNGHAAIGSAQNGNGQNGHAQIGSGQNGSAHNGSGQNGHSRNGADDPGFGSGADAVSARADGGSRHGRPEPDAPRRGR